MGRGPDRLSGNETLEQERGNGLRKALQRQLAQGFDLGCVTTRRAGATVDEDLAALRFVREARREIDHAADGGIVPAPLEPECAERGIALGDADAERELVAKLHPT